MLLLVALVVSGAVEEDPPASFVLEWHQCGWMETASFDELVQLLPCTPPEAEWSIAKIAITATEQYPGIPLPLHLGFRHTVSACGCDFVIHEDIDGAYSVTSKVCAVSERRDIPSLRIGTVNVWNINNWPGRRLRRISHVIASLDIALVQEVRYDWRRNPRNQLADLVRVLPDDMDFAWVPCMVYLHGLPRYYDVEGLAVFARPGLLANVTDTVFLQRDPADPEDGHQRCVQLVHTTQEFSLANSHFSLSKQARTHNVDQLGPLLERESSIAVFAGDLNAEPDDVAIEALREQHGFSFADNSLTFPSHNLTKKIDYLLHRNALQVRNCSRQGSPVASDHLFLVCDFDNLCGTEDAM